MRRRQPAATEVLREVRRPAVGTVLPVRRVVRRRAKTSAAAAGPISAEAAAEQSNGSRPTSARRPRCDPPAGSTRPLPCWLPSPRRSSPPGRYVSRAKQLIRQLAAERERRRIVAEEPVDAPGNALTPSTTTAPPRILESAAALRNGDIEELRATDRRAAGGNRHARQKNCARRCARSACSTCRPHRAVAGPEARSCLCQGAGRASAEALVDAAEKQLAEHHYDEALRLLEQIAPHLRSPHTQELYRQAAELAWLTWDLRNAPVVDETLAAVAERLRRLAPDDARAAETMRRASTPARLAEGRAARTPLPWARPPQPTPLGVPSSGSPASAA